MYLENPEETKRVTECKANTDNNENDLFHTTPYYCILFLYLAPESYQTDGARKDSCDLRSECTTLQQSSSGTDSWQ